MKTRFNLRLRLIIAFVFLTLVISSIFAIGLRYTLSYTEQGLINKYQFAEVNDFLEYYKYDNSIASLQRFSFTLYIKSQSGDDGYIPENITGLSIGFHEIYTDSREFHVYVKQVQHDTLYFIYDLTDFDDHEDLINDSLLVGIVLTVCLSIWAAYLTGSTVIYPVKKLATQIRELSDSTSIDFSIEEYADDEVGSLANEFKIYTQRLQAFLQREQDFTADVSHELRTPLTIINGAAEIMMANPELTEKTRKQAERIFRTGTDMAHTISAFLLLAREPKDVKDLPIDHCSVTKIIQQQMNILQHLLEGRPVISKLIANEDVLISADPQLISIIIVNLIRNAYTYTESGEIIITINKNEIWIEDTGPGIDPVLRDKVFERSFQINKRLGKGTGIGLSIAKRLADRYHWTISIDGRPCGGTKVTLAFSTVSENT